MLKKLLKYDWKFFWKVPTAINAFLGVITLVGIVSLLTPIWELNSNLLEALMVMLLLLYYVALFAGSIGVSAYIAVRYYKNIYTDEGYLTNTLPVTARQIVLSKTIIGTVWVIITGLVVILSIISLVFVAGLSYGDVNIFAEFSNSWAQFGAEIEQQLGMSLGAFILLLLFAMLAGSIFSIMMMYSAIALGQLFSKHKVAGAVIWYIGEYMIVQIGSSLLMNVPILSGLMEDDYYYSTLTFGDIFRPILLGSTVATILLSIGLFFLTEFMLKKKLNLD